MYYVLWTSTGREEKTRQMIYEFADPSLYSRILIPYRLKRHYYKGRSHIAKLILFPSYVFIETDRIKELVNDIKWFPGFNVVLHVDDLYCPVYKHEEQLLMKLVDDRGIIDISAGFMEGDEIRITSGPLVGQEGNILRINRRKGVAILQMNIFNRVTEVSLGLELLSSKK